MRVKPHILLKKGDTILIPGGNAGHLVTVEGLVDGNLWVSFYNSRFTLPRGFYLKCKNCYVPII